jgi:hypothetical protein
MCYMHPLAIRRSSASVSHWCPNWRRLDPQRGEGADHPLLRGDRSSAGPATYEKQAKAHDEWRAHEAGDRCEINSLTSVVITFSLHCGADVMRLEDDAR